MSQQQNEIVIASWEDAYPGCGQAIVEIIGRFFAFEPRRSVQPRNLEQRVQERNVVFWREISGVMHSHDPEVIGEGVAEPIPHSLRRAFHREITQSMGDERCAELGALLEFYVGPLAYRVCGMTLFLPIAYACSFIIMGKPERAKQFTPLLDLWIDGLFPMGFDKTNRLLFLVKNDQVN